MLRGWHAAATMNGARYLPLSSHHPEHASTLGRPSAVTLQVAQICGGLAVRCREGAVGPRDRAAESAVKVPVAGAQSGCPGRCGSRAWQHRSARHGRRGPPVPLLARVCHPAGLEGESSEHAECAVPLLTTGLPLRPTQPREQDGAVRSTGASCRPAHRRSGLIREGRSWRALRGTFESTPSLTEALSDRFIIEFEDDVAKDDKSN